MCNMKSPPAKIELDSLPNSDEEDVEGEYGGSSDKLHRPETLNVSCSQPTSIIDVGISINS